MCTSNNTIKTKTISGDDVLRMREAAATIANGGLVAFPTETVYGLGANALDENAAMKIYAAKGRPSDNPLIVHIADTKAVYDLASYVPQKAVALMEAFWPGPLTIVFPKKDIVPDGTTGGLKTVAIRMPSHPVALKLIKDSNTYIAAPSANTSGRPSPTLASHVIEDMTGKIEMIIDGGAVGIGIESTIVDVTGDTPTILRPGFITKKMLENIVGDVNIDPAIIEMDPNLRPKAPGMKYTHYAPHGELSIVEAKDSNTSLTDIAKKINELVAEKVNDGYNVAVIVSKETKDKYNCENILVAGSKKTEATVAASLYAVLRECDSLKCDYIFSESFDVGDLGGAIMNRLLKAAGHRVILV